MNFNSLAFAWFMPLVFIVYWLGLRNSRRAQNVWILVTSYLFYGWWSWRFCLLIGVTTVLTYACALPTRHRKAWTAMAVVANLAILVVFKYFNFFGSGLQKLFATFGFAIDWFTIDILLPVGISFYTFQAISYSVDVYRGDIAPTRNFIAFAGFISFFPQLVAGPIERSTQLLPQFLSPRRWNYAQGVEGMRLVLWGLFKKCMVADSLAILVDPLWEPGAGEFQLSVIFTGIIAFTIQIYADFSGYSDIARGVAKLLGFELMVNFRYPYFSRNIIEFWHRWHISLMEWFTRYVYIPLGGSRRGNRYVNITVVFLLSGLWHGPDITFVIWGAGWAVLYVIAIALKLPRYRLNEAPPAGRTDFFAMSLTFMICTVMWTFFRAPDLALLSNAFANFGWKVPALLIACIAGAWLISKWPFGFNFKAVYLAIIIVSAVIIHIHPEAMRPIILRVGMYMALLMFMVEWRGRNQSFALEVMPRRRWVRYAAYIGLYLLVISGCCASDTPFLYFQF